MLAPTPVAQQRTLLGMSVSAVPHLAFGEGTRIAAALLVAAAPLINLGGAKFTVAGKDGAREPIALQALVSRAALPNGKVNLPLVFDVLTSISPEIIISALVGAVQRLLLDDPDRAEKLQLAILANTSVEVVDATGQRRWLRLSNADAIASVVGTSYRRWAALLYFQLEVSFQDFFAGASSGGPPATGQP